MQFRFLSSLAVFSLILASGVLSSHAAVRFNSTEIVVHEKDLSVTVGIFGDTAPQNCVVNASSSSGNPPTTAVPNGDYTAGANFSIPGGGYGQANFVNLFGSGSFAIGLVDNNETNAERQIGLYFSSSSAGVGTPSTCLIRILDDDIPVGIKPLQPIATEQGEIRGRFLIWHEGPTTDAVSVSFVRTGSTASYTSDYILNVPGVGEAASGVTIPQGTNAVELRVVPNDDSTAEGDESVKITLVSGANNYYAVDPANASATISILDNDPVVSIVATDATASESGESGLITVTRTADTGFPVTVRYSLGGTAVNGVDYAYLSNVVVIPAGEVSATVTVAPLFDYLWEGNETVIFTLITNGYKLGTVTNATVTITDYDDNQRSTPVLGGSVSTNARYGRFWRGSGNDPKDFSFLVPIDFQQGIVLDNIGGNAAGYFTGNSWTTNFHYNATNAASPIPFANPIAAFGNRVGGSPLYFGQRYSFGAYAGDPKPHYTNGNTYATALRVVAYDRGTMATLGMTNVVIPNISNTNEWGAFLSNGWTKTISAFGLTTTLSFNNSGVTWNVLTGTSNYFDVAYHLTHVATSTGTQYVYAVELAGGTSNGWLVKDQGGNPSWSRLYTIEFEERPAWRTMLLQTPQFFPTRPIPSGYIGRSVEELLTNNPPVTNLVSVAPSAHTNLDHSPELRRSPVLDQFVADMGNDPLLLANYVLNEIELTDAMDYNESGAASEISVNLGGVNRGALGTFLEGQGSPTEQCALLVYLLRRAGYPAAYVFPPHNGLQLVDARLSKLLRTQVRWAVDNNDIYYTFEKLIPVNYPWVTAYVGTNWVHIFPWLKDTEVKEGFNLYDYMPAAYDNAYKWSQAYALGDTNLLLLNPEDDSPLVVYPKFLEKTLREKAAGLSLDEIGFKAWNRRHYYSRWSDLPMPTSVTNAGTVVVESLGASAITNVSPALTNIFNTISVEISSVNNPSKKVSSGELRMAEMLNRRLVAFHTKVTTNHTLTLALAAFRTNITASKAFSAAQLLNPADTNAIVNLTTNVTLNFSDDELKVSIVHKRHRSLPGNFGEPNYWTPYLGFSASLGVTNNRFMRKGDLAAICLDAGRVTRAMLEQHAQEIWIQEKAGTASATNDRYQGEIAYLMGMSFFEKADKFMALATRLHKAQTIINFSSGLAMLRAKRDAGGQLPNGNVIYIQPVVDMFATEIVAVGNGTAHLDSGDEGYGPSTRVFELAISALSALEHNVLNRFYQQSDSVSTVRLLQLAQSSNAVVKLNRFNYLTEGNKFYPANSATRLRDVDPLIWNTITNTFTSAYVSNNVQAFVTPGKISSPTRSYNGLGALIFGSGNYYALIGNGLNGGYSPILEDDVLATGSLPNTSLRLEQDNTVVLDSEPTLPVVGGVPYAPGTAVTTPDVADYVNDIATGTVFPDTQDAANDLAHDQLQITGSGTRTNVWEQYDSGVFAKTVNTPGGWVSDPVNAVTGEFYTDLVDLELHGPMPMQVRRNYSSHNVFDGDFGYGWKLNYAPFLSVSVDAQSRLLYAAEADGTVITYRRQTNAGVQQNTWAPLPKDNPRLQNITGSLGNPYAGVITMTTNSGVLTFTLRAPNGDVRTYKTNSFALSTKVKRNRPYLDRWQDSRGNFFKFHYGTNASLPDFGKVRRVESSSGNFLGFAYDNYGHITEAFTGDGRRLAYEYDDYGDLVRVRAPDDSETTYRYLHGSYAASGISRPYSTHLLIREQKPGGRLLLNEYDGERRVLNQYATVGRDLRPVRNASFTYSNNFAFRKSHTNFVTGYTLVTDYLTNNTRYEFTNSLITRILDPLGRETRQVWCLDSETNAPAYPRSLKRTLDRRGLLTEYQYDSKGNVVSSAITGDLTGAGATNEVAVTAFTYNTNALPIQITDAVGNQTRYTYTNPLSPFLRTSEERYASNGALIAATVFEHGHVTNATPVGNYFGSYGLLRRTTRAFGSSDAAVSEWNYDPHGFMVQEVRLTGTGDPTVSNSFFYNLRGQMVEMVDALGRATRQSFDARGNVEWREVLDEQGQLVSREAFYFNQNGELTWSDGPRSGPEDYVWRDYDGAGRKTQEVRYRTRARADGSGVEAETGDNLFATTFHEYDPFNNLVKVIDPRGNYARMNYDAMGQLRERRFYDGESSTNATPLSAEGFAYEAGGNIAFATNALGGVTEKQYTSAGRPKFQRNPTGATNAWRYYLDGRPRFTVQGNGAYMETRYDDAARRVTRVFYSATAVPLATNVSEHDRRGNLIRGVDEAGFAFTNGFDGLDRLRFFAGPSVTVSNPPGLPLPGGPPPPVQQLVTNYYSMAGQALTNVNAVGDKTITLFDALGRVTRTEIRSVTNTLVREADTAYAGDFHSYTVTEGASGATPVVTRHFTDTMGREVLTLRYPAAGQVEYVWQAFDAAGNRLQSRNYSWQSGVTTLWSTNGWTYDGLNRVRAQGERDGATITFSFDGAGNVTNRVMPGGLVWRAEYSSAGQLLKSFNLASGNAGTRTNTFTYYATGSPWAGLPQTSTDGRGVVCTHFYDSFLRPSTNSYHGLLAEHDQTVAWQYDARGLVTEITEGFSSGTNGPSTTIKRRYDAYGLLEDESLLINQAVHSAASQKWNSAGRRASLAYSGFSYVFGWNADGRFGAVSAGAVSSGYAYTTAGLLASRKVNSLNVTIASRDGLGRVLTRNSTLNAAAVLQETLAWTGDGLLSTHTKAREDFTDGQSFDYASVTRRLATERLKVEASKGWTNVFQYDEGVAAGAGVLTRVSEPQAGGSSWSASLDDFNRIERETNNVIRRLGSGRMNASNGMATLTVRLDGRALPLHALTEGDAAWRTRWQAMMELRPGVHTLQAEARHSSGQFTTNRSSTFTNNAVDQTTVSHFEEGQLSRRVWRNSLGQTNRVQTFKWDGRSRLLGTTELDASNNGYTWSAVYDALGRRIQTTTIIVTNGVALTNQPKVISSYFDPVAEFLELGVKIEGRTSWKIYGPDLNGTYGGMNGTGGLEGTVDDLGVFRAAVSDARGNVLAQSDPAATNLVWTAARPTGYGAVPEYRPVALVNNQEVTPASAWRGRWADLSGFYWLGARYYDPVAGRFISCDPLGHDSDASLYAFANGDPVNYFDPDGRLGAPASVDLPPDANTVLQTFLGDLQHRNNGWSIWSGGMSFFAPDVWPENDFGDSAPGTGLGFSFGESPMRRAFAELNRARDITVGAGIVIGGFIPWVGDALDVHDVVAPDSSAMDRTLSGASLTANAWTAGVLPNLGPIKRGLKLIEGLEKPLHQMPHHITPTPGIVGDFTRIETPWSRQVWQRSDIDWSLARPDGFSNLEAAEQGLSPLRKLSDGTFEGAQLHHLNQDQGGSLAEVWASTHHQINHNVPPPSWRVTDPAAAGAFRRETPAYWRWRAQQVGGK